jgi:hypothetical protein
VSNSSTLSALLESSDNKYNKTLVSKKLSASLIGIEPIEFEILGQCTTEFSQACQQLSCAGGLGHIERPFACHLNFDLVAFLQSQRVYYRRRKSDCETVAPFCDLHAFTCWWIYNNKKYILPTPMTQYCKPRMIQMARENGGGNIA